MQPDSSENQNNDLAERLELLRVFESGCTEAIQCPRCHEFSVSVWFTRPRGEYRTWFVCTHCPFSMRVQNSVQPPFFSESRVDDRLEAYDDVLGKTRFHIE
jgi:transposase-like protein